MKLYMYGKIPTKKYIINKVIMSLNFISILG